MIAQLFTFVVAFAYAFSPELAGFEGTLFATAAHLIGPLITTLTVASCFPSFSGARYASTWIGATLAISPLLVFLLSALSPRVPSAPASALIIQTVAGLWITAFSMLAKPIHETGGWRRALKTIDEIDLDWT